jgi:hypothetical protein
LTCSFYCGLYVTEPKVVAEPVVDIKQEEDKPDEDVCFQEADKYDGAELEDSNLPDNDTPMLPCLLPSPSDAIGTDGSSTSCGTVSSASNSIAPATTTSTFAGLFASATTSTTPQSRSLRDLIGVDPTFLCLAIGTPSSLFPQTNASNPGSFAPPPAPHMSATALLQKAAEAGSSQSGTSFLKEFGLASSSSSTPSRPPTGRSIDNSTQSQLPQRRFIDSSTQSQLPQERFINNSMPSKLSQGRFMDNSAPSQQQAQGRFMDTALPSQQLPQRMFFSNSPPSNLSQGRFFDNSPPSSSPQGRFFINSPPSNVPQGRFSNYSPASNLPPVRYIDSSPLPKLPQGMYIDSSPPSRVPQGRYIENSPPSRVPQGRFVDSIPQQWHQRSNQLMDMEPGPMVSGSLGLGLAYEGANAGLPDLMMGQSPLFGPKPAATMDFLGLGIGGTMGGSTANGGLPALMVGGELDMGSAQAPSPWEEAQRKANGRTIL